MKQYYKTLKVSRNATQEEIKNQYRQLAREYHPDKFQQSEEKQAAEVRFIEITEAYRKINDTFKSSVNAGYVNPDQPPAPVLSQTLLDFGTIHWGTRKTITFIVQNDGGPVESVRFDYDKARGWLKVQESVLQDDEAREFPLQVEVTVDTKNMEPQLNYQDKIDIWLNDEMARVTLVAGIKKQPKISTYLPAFSPQLIALMLFLIATISGVFAFAQTHEGPLIFADESYAISGEQIAMEIIEEGIGHSELASPTIDSEELNSTELNSTERVEVNLLETNRPLVFSKGTSQKSLYAMHAQLDTPYNLELSGYSPIWSPQGQKIAFLRDTDSGTQIFVANISATQFDGTTKEKQSIVFSADTPQQLTDTMQAKANISWSPDGRQLAFREQLVDDQGNSFEILKAVDVASKLSRLLSIPSQGNVGHFAWTSDSKTLFATFNGEASEKVYIVDIESGFAEPFVQFESRDAAWSPDGQQIAIASDQGLYLIDGDKENVKRLSAFSSWKPSWSPDGSALAFLGITEEESSQAFTNRAKANHLDLEQNSADLWLLDVDTEQITRLTTTGAIDFTWGPTEESLVYTAASTDSSENTINMWSLEIGGLTEIIDEVSDPQIAWVSQ